MLPEINVIRTKDTILSQFGGLNKKENCQDAEFVNMSGMVSDEFPYISTRQPYSTREFTTSKTITILGSCTFDEDLYSVVYSPTKYTDSHVCFTKNFTPVEINSEIVELLDTDDERTLIKSGAYIIIFPDNVMYNVLDNTIKSLDYYKPFTSHNVNMYLSDKNGVPFVSDSTTTFSYAVDPTTQQVVTAVGFYNVLMTVEDRQSLTNAQTICDEYINFSIISSTQNYSLKYGTLPLRQIDNSSLYPTGVHPLNICLSKKSQIEHVFDYTSYPLYYISTNTDREVVIQKYNHSQSAYLPIDTYVSIKTPITYDELTSQVSVGDFVKFYSYKSDDSTYVETDFTTKPNTWNVVKSYNDGLKIENIIKCTDNKALLVFSNSKLELEKIFKENGALTTGSAQNEDTSYSVEINYINNYFGFGWGSSTDSRNLVYETQLAKEVPELDYVIASANRLWGCSSANHEIYSSKQGDYTSWYCYAGLATDSYAVTIPSEGDFTGATVFNDTPYFFKENIAYAIYGSKPRNYQVQQFSCNGVEKGAHHTINQTEGYVYYKSREGIERFNGNNSSSVSDNLDLQDIKGYCADICCGKYYITLGTTSNIDLYCFDIKKGMWHLERNNVSTNPLLKINQNLYMASSGTNKEYLTRIIGKSKEASWILLKTPTFDTPKWFIESGEYNGGSLFNKYINKFLFELKLAEHSKLSISFSYNDLDEWEKVYTTENHTKKRLVKIPITPKRCERMKYKIEGEGQAKIYTITRTIEGGSEDGEYPY